jgi:hypothetical protein
MRQPRRVLRNWRPLRRPDLVLALYNSDRFLAADHYGGLAVGVIVRGRLRQDLGWVADVLVHVEPAARGLR